MQLSTVTKVVVGFAFGAVIGGGVISSIATLNDTSSQLATDSVRSGIKISQSNYPPMPPCTPPTPEQQQNGMNWVCPTEAEYNQRMQQNQQQQSPPPGQNPDPNQTQQQPNTGSNQYQPPAGQPNQTGQYPSGTQPPPNGQYPNQSQGGQPGQNGQPRQPFNAASNDIGLPPNVNYEPPRGLSNSRGCFDDTGDKGLANAVSSGTMTPEQAQKASRCFNTNIRSGGGTGDPGQPGPNGYPGHQVFVFSSEMTSAMAKMRPPETVDKCVVAAVGNSVATDMFERGVPPPPGVREKLSGCFGSPDDGSGGPNPGRGGPPGVAYAPAPDAARPCLDKIPDYDSFQSGGKAPDPNQFRQIKKCFRDNDAYPPYLNALEVSPNSTAMNCFKAVGDISDSSSFNFTVPQLQATRACFAPTGGQIVPPKPSMSAKTTECLTKLFGSDYFAKISVGGIDPKPGDIEKGKTCFDKLGLSKTILLADAALPKDQARVLLEANIDTKLAPVVNLPSEDELKADPNAEVNITGVLAKGTDQMNSVEVYVNSELVIKTAEVKENAWGIKLALSGLKDPENADGKHTAYAVVTNPDGSLTRSNIISFEAKAADSTETTSTATSRNMLILYGVLGALALAIIGFILVRRKHRVTA